MDASSGILEHQCLALHRDISSVTSSTAHPAWVPAGPQHPACSCAGSTKSTGRHNSPQAEGKQEEQKSRALWSWASPCASSLPLPGWEIPADAATRSSSGKGRQAWSKRLVGLSPLLPFPWVLGHSQKVGFQYSGTQTSNAPQAGFETSFKIFL